MLHLSPERFEELVAEALDEIPDELAALMDNVVVVVEDRCDEPGEADLLGRYEGVSLTEREDYGGFGGGFVMPDRISIFRLPLCAACADEDELVEEVAVTVVHEVAHHFGIDDDRLVELGWD